MWNEKSQLIKKENTVIFVEEKGNRCKPAGSRSTSIMILKMSVGAKKRGCQLTVVIGGLVNKQIKYYKS